ncbi:unnamed protein product [Effrenium voratum]|nr:unnamed protein product [Effrenium voratum]
MQYGNLSDFSLSICQCPDASGQLQWGWIIGREGQPAYGVPAAKTSSLPRRGWQCFQGPPPGPTLRRLDAANAAAAYAAEAKQRGRSAEAVKAYHRALEAIPAPDWRQVASLRCELGELLLALNHNDQAAKEAQRALALRPAFCEALLLMARATEDPLPAKQCWLQVQPTVTKSCTAKLRNACKELMSELNHPCDTLPRSGSVSLGAETQEPRTESAGKRELVQSILVEGCSMQGVNGTYEPTRAVSNHFPVFANAHGFRLSMEMQPSRSSGEVRSGWVIGQSRAGFFGTPSGSWPSGEWQAFPAAGGARPPARCALSAVPLDEALARGHEARLGRGGGPEEALEVLSGCLERSQGGQLEEVAFALTELAAAQRLLKQHSAAAAAVQRALELCPSHWEAYLEAACIHCELGNESEARLRLRQLLVSREDSRAAMALLQLPPHDWLQYHAEIPLVAEYIKTVQPGADQVAQKLDQITCTEFKLEDQRREVHAHWVVPGIKAKDVRVQFKEEELVIEVGDLLLFEGRLAHRIIPSQSGWTLAAPDLTITLSKCMVNGKWPRWEVLHKEDAADRLERLGGLFDEKSIQWL